jgi:hypothetical protein
MNLGGPIFIKTFGGLKLRSGLGLASDNPNPNPNPNLYMDDNLLYVLIVAVDLLMSSMNRNLRIEAWFIKVSIANRLMLVIVLILILILILIRIQTFVLITIFYVFPLWLSMPSFTRRNTWNWGLV